MSENDADKLEAAIAQLETERIRRVLDRVAAGTAIFDGKLIIGGAPSGKSYELKPYRKDDQGRDVYAGPAPVIDEDGHAPRIMEVVTGVPRGVDDSDDADTPDTKPEPKSYMHQRYEPIKPAPSDEPEPITSPPIFVRVQIEAPNDRNPGGTLVDAVALIEPNGQMTVRDRETGKPLGTAQVAHGDDFKAVARRVVLRTRGSSDFWRTLQ